MMLKVAFSVKETLKRGAFELCYGRSRFMDFGALNQLRPIKVITAFDDSHFLTGIELIKSVMHHAPQATIHVWDLGLTKEPRSYLECKMPDTHVETFPFSRFPKHYSILGNFGWKPSLIWDEAANRCGYLVYLDAGNRLTGSLDRLLNLAAPHGFFSPFSAGTIGELTHHVTLAGLRASTKQIEYRNLNGAISVWDLETPWAIALLDKWRLAALKEQLLCPPGSDRTNHRFDQSLLSYLAYQEGYSTKRCTHSLNKGLHCTIHQDGAISKDLKKDFPSRHELN